MKPLAPAPPNVHPDAAGFLFLLPFCRQAASTCTGHHPVRLNLLPLLCFFALGLLGMVLMMVFALYLSSADPKTN